MFGSNVIWDMGAIAMHGGPAGLKLFRQVIIASSSIPGLFPPVIIPVESFGTTLEEMHVDGSTTASMFIAPEIAAILPDQLRGLRGANVYVMANEQYGAATVTTRLRTPAILKRGVQAALHSSTREPFLPPSRSRRKTACTSMSLPFPMTIRSTACSI